MAHRADRRPKCDLGRARRGSHTDLHVSTHKFDIVATAVMTALYDMNVPEQDLGEFMATINSYRSVVVHPAPAMA